MKIQNDKYYTGEDVVRICFDHISLITFQLGIDIEYYIDPCVGDGAFYNRVIDYFPFLKNRIGVDIHPESDQVFVESDYLSFNPLFAREKTLIVTNPPFGERLNLARKIICKAVKESVISGFILPISQIGKSDYFSTSTLISSIDLGKQIYSGRELHCCFNVFQQSEKKRDQEKCDKIIIKRDGDRGFEDFDFDFAIYRRGSSTGKIRTENLHTQTYKIKVKEGEDVNKIKELITKNNWVNHISTPGLMKIDIIRFINKMI